MESEGKAAEVEEMRKRTKEEETTSGQRKINGEREGSRIIAKRVRPNFGSSLLGKVVAQMSCGVRGDATVFWLAEDRSKGVERERGTPHRAPSPGAAPVAFGAEKDS